MVRLQTEQESGEFAGVVYGRFRCSGSKLLESLAQACPFHFAYGGGSCPRRDIGASAVDQQLAELFDGRYRHRAGNGYLDQYDGAGLETEASKDVASAFINGRPNDNIGLVVFAAESFTQCPLTTDHTVLLNLFKDVQPGIIQDGTAIGLGLANAVSRIKDSQAKSKVIILLTDGVNNQGEIAPVTAAEIAKTFGVRVYTIGVGTQGKAPYPFQTAFGVQYMDVDVEIDEPTLKQIAATTGGQYFRATDNASLKEIYSEIDKMEKTKISVQEYSKKQEEYKNWAILLFSLLLVEILLRNTLLRNIP